MLIWRGWGILGLLVPFLSLVAAEALVNGSQGPGSYQENVLFWGGLALFIAGLLVLSLGRRLNGAQGKRLMDPETGEEVVLRRRHDLFFVPLQYWGLASAVAGLIMFVIGLF